MRNKDYIKIRYKTDKNNIIKNSTLDNGTLAKRKFNWLNHLFAL